MKNILTSFPITKDGTSLTNEEIVLLSYFAMHDAREEEMRDIMDVINSCSAKLNIRKVTSESLVDAKLLCRLSFNYSTHDFIYCINESCLSDVLIWLYDSDEGHSVLDLLKKVFGKVELRQTLVQKSLCFYILSGYKDVMAVQYLHPTDIPSVILQVDNDNFQKFFSAMTEDTLQYLVRGIITRAHQEGSIPVKPERLISIVRNATLLSNERCNELIQSLMLYAFLAEGRAEAKHIPATTIDGIILKAIIAACEGKWEKSLASFRQCQIMYNKMVGRTTSSVMMPYVIANVVYVIAAWRIDSEEGRKIIDYIIRKYERSKNIEIRAAWVLALTLTNRPNYVAEMRYLVMSENPISIQIMTMLARFADRSDIISSSVVEANALQWLFLRYDNERHEPLPSELRKKADEAYSGNHMLNDIYRKQRWEYVLEGLSNPSAVGSVESTKPAERLGYYLQDIYDDQCEVRMQTVLKSGLWGSGKAVSYVNYMALADRHLTPSDHIIRSAERLQRTLGKRTLSLVNVLPEMVNESRLYVGKWAPYTLVAVMQDMPYLIVEQSESGFEVKSNVSVDDVDNDVIIVSRSASGINFVKMTPELRPYFSQLLTLRHFPPEARDALADFLESLRGKVEVHSALLEGGSTLEKVQGSSQIVIQMRPQGKEGYMVSVFCRPLMEGSVQVVPGEGTSVVFDAVDGRRVCVERNMEEERESYERMLDYTGGVVVAERVCLLDPYDILELLDYVRNHPDIYVIEWPEGHPMRLHQYTSSMSGWNASIVKKEDGWFEMEGEVELNENTRISIQKLFEIIGTNRKRFIKINDEEFLALNDRLHKQLLALDAFVSRTRGRLRMSPFIAALLDPSLTDGQLHLSVDPELVEIRRRIVEASTYTPDVPSSLKATLRGYQKEGYQWISRLNHWGAGALLADDMGLGKTVQTIAFLLSKAEEGPALVVAPASVAPNWITELEKFAPSLHVEMLNFAPNRSMCIAEAKAGDVIITSYGLLLSVKDFITQKDWTTVVLDEAHVIKNRGAKTSGVAMQLKTKYRVMLTGTPVQNHLGELWSLFQFVNPGLLGSYEDFRRRFIVPIESESDKQRQSDLDRLVHPFMLRRTKDKVLAELPEKTEIYSRVSLSDEEMAVYEVIRERAYDSLVREQFDHVSLDTLAEITRLRQAACSAELIEKKWKGKTSKAEALIEALEPIVESGDAALVFSQFTSFLAIVQRELRKAGIPFIYMDGSVSVKERQKLVDSFQSGECPVFLISLKAGGLGLNLTRANYVFHLDPWWNPAIEQQATDRAYRIGQHNPVTVYHFLAANTIEEKIRRMHEKKRDLADNILEGTDLSGKITGKELLEMVN